MYYIFVVNNLDLGTKTIDAEELVKHLFEKDVWLFNGTHPLKHQIKKLELGSKVLIYVSGKDRRYFIGSLEIAGEVTPLRGDIEEELKQAFEYSIPIKNQIIFKERINIAPLINDLVFISNKKYWGLALRQSLKKIPVMDYKLILKNQN